MKSLFPLLIVAIIPTAPIALGDAEGTEVFYCDFGESWDKNFDDEADGWRRQLGQGFPEYLSIKISEDPAPTGNRCLRIDLDGGGAAYYSPPIRVGPLYSYVLEGFIQEEDLKYAQLYFSLTLLDEDRRRLETYYSDKYRHTDDWTEIRLGPVSPTSDEVRQAIIGLHVQPGERADLDAVVRFAGIRLARLPRISLSANNRHHLFTDSGQIKIHCDVSGFTQKDLPVTFRLEDATGVSVAETVKRLKTRIGTGSYALTRDSESDEPPCLIGAAQWNPPVPGPGFYRVWMVMTEQDGLTYRRDLTLAVIKPHSNPPGGEFGWSLPSGDHPLPLRELGQVVVQAGINWVKYPLWYDADADEEYIQQLIRFSERLAYHGIELVGLLHDPPEALRQCFDTAESPSAAEIFDADPEVWYPSLEMMLMRMAAQVRWWQLGLDKDTGFVDYPNLPKKIAQVKGELDRIGYDVNLGFGWGWLNQLPQNDDDQPAWRFLTLSTDPPLTHRELPSYLAVTQREGVRRWMVLEPLGRDHYTRDVRIVDLVERMMSAKIHQAEGVFVPDPFDAQRGLMQDDGTPGDLFLPWRTTALMLGGSEFLGGIQLPEGSENRIFVRGEETVMVIWNDKPQQEVVYLGKNTRHVDLWGRERVPEAEKHRQVFDVGPLPTFITGVDKSIVQWRQSFSFSEVQIPSIFGRRHQNSLRMTNYFKRGISGTLKLVMPDTWEVEPGRIDFQLPEGGSREDSFLIALAYNATSGRHPVRIDLELQSEETVRFSIYRHIDIGFGDVYIEFVTTLNDRGELEIEQRFVNETKKRVNFRCHLYAPDRRRRKTEVLDLGYGRNVQYYLLPNGKELIGQTIFFRAVEIDGRRILPYTFEARR